MSEELLAQIEADPEDIGPYLVYADWLAQSADPIDRARGEWIVAEVRGLHAEAKEHERVLAPQLAPLALGEDDRLAWRRGFITHATICDPHFRRPRRPASRELLAALYALPAARMLRNMWIAAHSYDELEEIIAELHVAPRTLYQLSIGERFPDSDDIVDGIALGGLEPLWSLDIAKLSLCAGRLALGSIVAPRLEAIQFVGGLVGDAVDALANARWPALSQFGATHGRYEYGSYGETGLFDGDALCEVIARSTWGAQLVYLDLTHCGVSDAGVRCLFGLPRLEMIDLTDNTLGAETLAEARARWRLLNVE